MSKVVINNCYGGYSLSYKAMKWLSDHGLKEAEEELSERAAYLEKDNEHNQITRLYRQYHSIEDESFYPGIPRHHPLLIQCVEELGEETGGMRAELIVVAFEGNLYRIAEYDGMESIETPDCLNWTDSSKY